ncbi:OmpA family protein [Aeromonas veronii]
MKHMTPTLLSTLVFGLMSLHATASEGTPDIYLGAGAGFTHFQGLNKIEGVETGSEDAAAANAFAGYNLNDYLGAELGYVYGGRGNTDGNRFENQGGTLSLIGRVPLADGVSLFGEAGGYWAHTDGLGAKDTKVSSLFGAGVTYQLTDALDVQARWRYITDVADLHSSDYQTRIKPNQNMTTLEMVYHPFRSSYVEPVAVTPPTPAPEPVMVDKTFELNSDVLFAFGKAELKAEGLQALATLYRDLAAARPKDGEAIVVGYTDRIGSDKVNLRLSAARAEAVADYLASQGLPAGKIRVEGRGAEDSLTGSDCDGIKSKAERISCLAPDRRVEVRITGVKSVMEQ